MMKFSNTTSNAREMDANRHELIMQRWNVIQHDLFPDLRNDIGPLTHKLEKVIHTLKWMRIEECTDRQHKKHAGFGVVASINRHSMGEVFVENIVRSSFASGSIGKLRNL